MRFGLSTDFLAEVFQGRFGLFTKYSCKRIYYYFILTYICILNIIYSQKYNVYILFLFEKCGSRGLMLAKISRCSYNCEIYNRQSYPEIRCCERRCQRDVVATSQQSRISFSISRAHGVIRNNDERSYERRGDEASAIARISGN